MTDDELDALQALCDGATPGPWVNCPRQLYPDAYVVLYGCNQDVLAPDAGGDVDAGRPAGVDQAFVAAARTALPALVAEARRLRAAAERDALARLEAWRKANISRQRYACFGSATKGWWVRLQDGARAVHVEGHSRPEDESDGSTTEGGRVVPPWRFWVGTDDAPATLADVIHAALGEWAKTYEGGMAR